MANLAWFDIDALREQGGVRIALYVIHVVTLLQHRGTSKTEVRRYFIGDG